MLIRLGVNKRAITAAVALSLVLILGTATGAYPVTAATDASNTAAYAPGDRGNQAVAVADGPDLIIQDITLSPEEPTAGNSVTVIFAVRNQGTEAAGYSHVACYIDDILIESHQISPLDAGATVTTTFPWTAEAGSHSIRAVADANDQINETIESNNTKVFTASVPASDLIIEAISWTPENPSRNDSITFTVTIKNQGTIGCNYFRVNFYIDENSRGYQDISSIAPGATVTRTYAWTALTGQHEITAAVDEDNRVKESDESNNSLTLTFSTLAPDLIVQDITWTPANPSRNDDVTFTVTIKNQGNGRADSQNVAFYIDDVFLTSAFTISLESGSSANATFGWTAEPDAHEIRAVVDYYEQVAETDENNNEKTVPFLTLAPDLTVQEITWTPVDVAAGDTVTFSAVIKNQGGGRSEVCRIACLINENYIGHIYIPEILAGETSTQTFQWEAVSGRHTVGVQVDCDEDVDETNEDNNSETETLYVSFPDLVIKDITWSPQAPLIGETVTFSVNITNQGNGIAEDFRVIYYLDDAILTSDYYTQMDAGQSFQRNLDWEVQSGAHVFKVVVDFNTNVEESDETNNELEATITPVMPDLMIDNITWSPADYAEGDEVIFSATIKNQGSIRASPFRVTCYIDDSVVGHQDIAGLDASTTVTESFTWIALDGAHYIKIAADTNDQIEEGDETNNTRTVTTPPPDLTVGEITWSPLEPSIGDQVTLTFNIKNRGNGWAGESQAIYYIDDSLEGSRNMPALEASATAAGTFTWVAEYGEHAFRIVSDTGNQVIEADETNNDKTVQLTPVTPDLIIEDIGWSVENTPESDNITLNVIIRNQGRDSAGISQVACYLNDADAGTEDVPEINSGATATVTLLVSAEVGVHAVRAVADAGDTLIETDETNNEKSIEISALAPDLVIQDVTWGPEEACAGDNVTFTVSLENLGNGTAANPRLDLYVDGAPVSYYDLGDIDAGATVTREFTWTALEGTHDISLFVDLGGLIVERDESNNTQSLTLSAEPVEEVTETPTTTPEPPEPTKPITIRPPVEDEAEVSLLGEWWWIIFGAMLLFGGVAIFIAVRAYRNRY